MLGRNVFPDRTLRILKDGLVSTLNPPMIGSFSAMIYSIQDHALFISNVSVDGGKKYLVAYQKQNRCQISYPDIRGNTLLLWSFNGRAGREGALLATLKIGKAHHTLSVQRVRACACVCMCVYMRVRMRVRVRVRTHRVCARVAAMAYVCIFWKARTKRLAIIGWLIKKPRFLGRKLQFLGEPSHGTRDLLVTHNR